MTPTPTPTPASDASLALAREVVEYFGDAAIDELLTTDIWLRDQARAVIAQAEGRAVDEIRAGHAAGLRDMVEELLDALHEAEDALDWSAGEGKVVANHALKTVRAAIAKAEDRPW